MGRPRRVPLRLEEDDGRLHPAGAGRARSAPASIPIASWAGSCGARWTRTRPTPMPPSTATASLRCSCGRRRARSPSRSRPPSRERTSSSSSGKGNTYTMSVARFGDLFTVSTASDLDLGDEVYVGPRSSCSAQPGRGREGGLPRRAHHPSGQGRVRPLPRLHRQRTSRSSTWPAGTVRSCTAPLSPSRRRTGRRTAARSSTTPAGAWRAAAASSASTSPPRQPALDRHRASRTATTTTTSSPSTGRCSPSATRARATAGPRSTPCPWRVARRSTSLPLAPSYLHGWSPDGKFSSTPGGRNDEFDIYRIASDGSGPEVNLTKSKGLDDGPEYSPDGRYVYFNSLRSGTMQIWRMKRDGSDPRAGHERRIQQLVPPPLARRAMDRLHQLPQGRRAPPTTRTTSGCTCG